MQHHNLAHWPLVVSVSTGAPTLADTQAFSQAWDEWLAREQPFASLRVFADAASLTHLPAPPSTSSNGSAGRHRPYVIRSWAWPTSSRPKSSNESPG